MLYKIPGRENLEIRTIILDLNGTLTVGGIIVAGVHAKIQELKKMGFSLVLFTGNTRNDADEIAKELDINWKLAKTAQDKRVLAEEIGAETAASIGNGLIDLELMQAVSLSIVTLQAEGVNIATLRNSDIVVPSILDALDLFIDSNRLIATLRS